LFLTLSRFVDFITLDNDIAGIEYIQADAVDSPWGGAMVRDSLIIGHSKLRDIGSYDIRTSDQANCTRNGIHLPLSARLTVSNVTLVNFDEDVCVTFGACAHCKPDDGGAIVRFNKLKMVNSPNRVRFPFQHASALMDEDGTLTGHTGGSIVPNMGTLDPTVCTPDPASSKGIQGVVCSKGEYAQMRFNNIRPNSISEKDAFLENTYGKDMIFFRKKAKKLKLGWTALVPLNDTFTFSFKNSTQFTNISYFMELKEVGPKDYFYLKHIFKQNPDHFSTVPSKQQKNTMQLPVPAKHQHGDWFYEKQALTYLISGKGDFLFLINKIIFDIIKLCSLISY